MPLVATVVLVHGAWHGAWCWEKVLPLLESAGVEARAVDLPDAGGVPGDLTADVAAVREVLDNVGAPAVLCGHSYGGAVITEAGLHRAVSHLVYIAAFVPDAGMSVRDLPRPEPGTARLPAVLGDDGLVRLTPTAVDFVYQDCDPADVDAARLRWRAQRPAGFGQPVSAAAWRSCRSTYALCLDDRSIDPRMQRAMAERAGSEIVEWPTGHSPFFSRPDLVADLLTDAAHRPADGPAPGPVPRPDPRGPSRRENR
jgi:pimeloyl-ACP methyl ester carboxylesterase